MTPPHAAILPTFTVNIRTLESLFGKAITTCPEVVSSVALNPMELTTKSNRHQHVVLTRDAPFSHDVRL